MFIKMFKQNLKNIPSYKTYIMTSWDMWRIMNTSFNHVKSKAASEKKRENQSYNLKAFKLCSDSLTPELPFTQISLSLSLLNLWLGLWVLPSGPSWAYLWASPHESRNDLQLRQHREKTLSPDYDSPPCVCPCLSCILSIQILMWQPKWGHFLLVPCSFKGLCTRLNLV